ncbi:16S rRNA (cytidine(1402)-2'-O)-methyltransferase [Opitutales bacterium ASA1]|uniref:16S rRNA (cytidine(1402)-2'-O)-methyltransferase n=1 Tax=Congregicoccus parvus TaxID=3081749 RepID=UPI002B2F62AB|nr:16S rRNA (cytidine(1402)-2'-O)-methyltransferase [Opitutales bacterium ASA1]
MTAENASLQAQPATLYVVATPIGNLADLTERAAALLCSVQLVACEDTRTTRVLLDRIGARPETVAYHEHNEQTMATRLADRIAAGASVAVVSDAGTPGLSDPGFRIVRECRRRGLAVVPVPGPNALLALLCSAGLPTNAFFFAGFLPARTAARRTFLERYRDFPHTIALYESCHRIAAFLDEIAEVLGATRVVAVGKELTKRHETILAGPVAEVRSRLASLAIKGEFTVLIAPEDYGL